MSDIISFKERVRQVAINEARHYKRMFVDYDYLICCNTFTNKKYYVISGEKNNYAHLLGINILCSPNEFFAKCISNSLTENDFDFFKSGQRETDVKGTVRRKITSLEKMKYMFSGKLLVEESFRKNNVFCAIATTDLRITVGFSVGKKSYPKSLLKGNELSGKAVEPTVILRRKSGSRVFSEVIYGDKDNISLFIDEISNLLLIDDKTL